MYTRSTGAMPIPVKILTTTKKGVDDALNELYELFDVDDVRVVVSNGITVAEIYIPIGDENETGEAWRNFQRFVKSMYPKLCY